MAGKTHVGIIGGGIAGLAAATKLAERGIQTTILEAGSQLGGRARNVAVEFNSQVVQLDNGQHILLGAYRQTLSLLKLVGIDEARAMVRMPLTLDIRSFDHNPSFKLSTNNLFPYPLNQLYGFLFCKGLSLRERLTVVQFMLNLKRTNYQLTADKPLYDYLMQNKQSQKTIALLWEPLCLAALNTPARSASSAIFLNVLRDTFSAQHNSDLLLPKLGLSTLFAQPIKNYLLNKGGQVLTGHRVKSILKTENGFAVKSKEDTFDFSHIIIATTGRRLQNIAAGIPKLAQIVETTDQYQYQPIYTIYIQYADDIKLSKPMVGLSGTLSQWVFDRGLLCGQYGLMAVIISAEGEHQRLTQSALAQKVANELCQAFPILKKPLWHQVIAEKRATFSCNVNLTRPANSTPQSNLFIAGDYTYAEYPATIEGAVRSGFNAASMVIS